MAFLFSASSERQRVLRAVAHANVIYLDTVRLFLLLRQLRHRQPDVHLVCDMDDLMSRRMMLLRDLRLPLSLGYLEQRFPHVAVQLLAHPWIARLVVGFEEATLRRTERETVALSNAVTLVSRSDAEGLAETLGPAAGQLARRLHVIPPPVEPQLAPEGPVPPLRFIFLGSDRLIQNRLTIEHLLSFWRRWQPSVELHLFGKLLESYDTPPGVVARGYVDDFAEIYDGQTTWSPFLYCW